MLRPLLESALCEVHASLPPGEAPPQHLSPGARSAPGPGPAPVPGPGPGASGGDSAGGLGAEGLEEAPVWDSPKAVPLQELLASLRLFAEAPPWTVQRVCELLLAPRPHYAFWGPLSRALEKLLTVSSGLPPWPPGALPDSPLVADLPEANRTLPCWSVSLPDAGRCVKVVDFCLPEAKEREEAEAASADPRAAERGGVGPDFAAGGVLMEVDRPGGSLAGAGNGAAGGEGPSGGDSFGGWVPDASDASVGPNERGPLSPSEAAPHWTPTRSIAFTTGGGNGSEGPGSPVPPGRPRVTEAAEGPVMVLPASGPLSAFGGLKGGAGGASLANDPDLPSSMAAGFAPAVPGGNGSSGAGAGAAAGEGSGEADWGAGPGLGETFCPGAFPPILEVVPGKRMKVEEVAPTDAGAEAEGAPAAAPAVPAAAGAGGAAAGGGLPGGQGGPRPPT